jgi:hypothetical protein
MKIIALVALGLMLAAGSATVITVAPQPAKADGGNCSTC